MGEIIFPRRPGAAALNAVKPHTPIRNYSTEWRWFWDNSGLVDAWIFGEGSGNTTYSYGPAKNHGTFENSSADITWGYNNRGSVVEISGDGTDDRIQLGSITSANRLSLFGRTQMSCVWGGTFKSAIDSYARFIDKSTSGVYTNGWSIARQGTATKVTFGVDGLETTGVDILILDGSFHNYAYVATTVDGTGTDTGYRDGAALATNASINKAFSSATAECAIGNWNHTTGRQVAGGYSYMYIFDKALTANRISLIHADPFGPFRASPVLFPLEISAAAAGGGADNPFFLDVIWNM